MPIHSAVKLSNAIRELSQPHECTGLFGRVCRVAAPHVCSEAELCESESERVVKPARAAALAGGLGAGPAYAAGAATGGGSARAAGAAAAQRTSSVRLVLHEVARYFL